MDLATELARALPEFRAAALSLMQDTFALDRPTGPPGTDNETGEVVQPSVSLGTSVGKIQSRNLTSTDAEVGARTSTTIRLELHLPVDAPVLAAGDLATMTAAGPLTPAALVGRPFRVVAPVGKSWATAMRYELETIVA